MAEPSAVMGMWDLPVGEKGKPVPNVDFSGDLSRKSMKTLAMDVGITELMLKAFCRELGEEDADRIDVPDILQLSADEWEMIWLACPEIKPLVRPKFQRLRRALRIQAGDTPGELTADQKAAAAATTVGPSQQPSAPSSGYNVDGGHPSMQLSVPEPQQTPVVPSQQPVSPSRDEMMGYLKTGMEVASVVMGAFKNSSSTGSSDRDVIPPTSQLRMEVWWPENGKTLTGTHPFKVALINTRDQSKVTGEKYDACYYTDGKEREPMRTASSDGGFVWKEALVNVTDWKWKGRSGCYGPFKITFEAKLENGQVMTEERTIYNGGTSSWF